MNCNSGRLAEIVLFLFSALVVQCSENTYKCNSSQCISKLNPECDGEVDCEDRSDELGCGKSLALSLWATFSLIF